MIRFFADCSIEDARRAAPPGAPPDRATEETIAALPMASLKHIARAAQAATADGSIRDRIELLIVQKDARGLGRYLEALGAEGKLGSSWAPSDFVSARGIKRSKSRAGKRTSRRRAETTTDILRRRAIVVSKRIVRKLLSPDDLTLLGKFDAVLLPDGEASGGGCEGFATAGPVEPRAEAIANLEEMIAALPHVQPVDLRTWKKLSELTQLRKRANALIDQDPSGR